MRSLYVQSLCLADPYKKPLLREMFEETVAMLAREKRTSDKYAAAEALNWTKRVRIDDFVPFRGAYRR